LAVCKLSDVPARGKRTIHPGGRTVVIIACSTGLYAVEVSQPSMARKLAHGQVLDGMLTMPNDGARYDLETGQCIANGAWSLPHERLRMLKTQVVDDMVYLRLT
jgi:nitrite reductase/ring-hydroxylating ferredoxin subunit